MTVPDLEGSSFDDAVRKLQDAGLLLGDKDEEASESEMKDKVIGQTPSSGSTVAKGTKVSIVIGTGPEPDPEPVSQSGSGSDSPSVDPSGSSEADDSSGTGADGGEPTG